MQTLLQSVDFITCECANTRTLLGHMVALLRLFLGLSKRWIPLVCVFSNTFHSSSFQQACFKGFDNAICNLNVGNMNSALSHIKGILQF